MIGMKPLLQLELRRVEAPGCATPGACVFMLLPSLDELLGSRVAWTNQIRLPACATSVRSSSVHGPIKSLH
jgi:hypothetical protein